jgi:hypothetical protein
MSFPSFFMGHAWADLNTEKIIFVFNLLLGEGVVDNARFSEEVDNETGIPYKVFYVPLKKSTSVVEELMERFKTEHVVNIEYKGWVWQVKYGMENRFKEPYLVCFLSETNFDNYSLNETNTARDIIPRLMPRE